MTQVAPGEDSWTVDPPPGPTWAAAGAALVLLLVATRTDPAGRLLAGAAALAALALVARDLLRRPLLHADAAGLALVDGWRRVSVGWDEVEELSARTDRRAQVLVVDTGDARVVLSRSRLGVRPAYALERLSSLRASGEAGPGGGAG